MRLLSLLMLAAQIAAAPQTADAPLTISISALKTEIAYGSQIPYSITLTNHTDHKIDCGNFWSGPEKDQMFEITDRNGKKVLPRPVRVWVGSERPCWINPGETTGWESAVIPSDYPGLVPSDYRIRVSAQNPDNPSGERLYSNTVTIKIESASRVSSGDQNPDERESKPPVALILSPEHTTVTSDGKFNLGIRVTNQSQTKIPCANQLDSSGVDEDFTYEIYASDGKQVRRVREPGSLLPVDYPSWALPGESCSEAVYGLMDAFEMRKPGTYTVQVSRADPAHPGQMLATSNVVTVTVKAPSGNAAQEPTSALQLILSPDHITATPDSNFDLSIKWVNQSRENIRCMPMFSPSKIDESYVYDVRSGDGMPVPRVPVKGARAPGWSSDCVVGPGRSMETSIGCLMCAFEMRQPGVYTVQVSRPDPDHPGQMLGTSNVVTVTVKAPQ